MNGLGTISQKGQIVIPLDIRRYFGLQASDKLYFEIDRQQIIARPILSVEEAMGMISAKKVFSKSQYKKTIYRQVLKKFD